MERNDHRFLRVNDQTPLRALEHAVLLIPGALASSVQ